MRLFRLILLTMLGLHLVLVASAQIRIVPREQLEAVASPRLSADSSSLVFDTRHIMADPMNEDDGPKTFVYRFRNASEGVLTVRRLVSTCSCATASCSAGSVAPGETDEISVRYDPKGHPGRFERKVFVYTMEGDSPAAVLRLSVEVETGKDLSGDWPVQMGPVRMRRETVCFTEGVKAVEKIRFMNLSGRPLALGCEETFLPECLSFRTEPSLVQDGEEGEIVISYDPLKKGFNGRTKVMLKGLGLPPSRSSVSVVLKQDETEENR